MTNAELTLYCFDWDSLKYICPRTEEPQLFLDKLSSLIREKESLFEALCVNFCREIRVSHDPDSLDDLNEDISNSQQSLSNSEIGVSIDKVRHSDCWSFISSTNIGML